MYVCSLGGPCWFWEYFKQRERRKPNLSMEEQKYFKQAISNFTFEAACGGAIRHLADLGYSVKQITEQLSYPVPYEKVQKTVWEYFLENGVLFLEEPGKQKMQEKADYVKEYNKYGRASFRRVVSQKEAAGRICFKEKHFDMERDGDFSAFLTKKCGENWMDAYVLLDFTANGKAGNDLTKEAPQMKFSSLDTCQQDYMNGLFDNRRGPVFHRINALMRDIIIRLYKNDNYHGKCYFIKTGEMIIL